MSDQKDISAVLGLTTLQTASTLIDPRVQSQGFCRSTVSDVIMMISMDTCWTLQKVQKNRQQGGSKMAVSALAQRVKKLNICLQQKVVSEGGAIISETLWRLLASFITIESVWVYVKILSERKPTSR